MLSSIAFNSNLRHYSAVLDYGPTIVYNVPARTASAGLVGNIDSIAACSATHQGEY